MQLTTRSYQCADWENRRGLLYSYLSKYSEAADCFKRSLSIEPNVYKVTYNLSVAMYRWRGASVAEPNVRMARNSLNSMLRSSERPSALYGLGGLEALNGNQEAALKYLEQALASAPKGLAINIADWAQHDTAWLEVCKKPRFIELVSPFLIRSEK